ncbi:DUF4390 domain-containing protein [Pusillimonas sp. CC-YST705]|uniref:DUF4390 domain-containing protein n=1 Tax=Mesopusillimonas faecipullorum TaxID=2755040 RepID=A0ABS8CCK7_9BURK|nr:DUF4390 domain-containing protein [Mesopusillimonas faecipullorum]MCB5363572.1 DUF4390 domain-containing protein [Mesopusillimonas faecipullorum]
MTHRYLSVVLLLCLSLLAHFAPSVAYAQEARNEVVSVEPVARDGKLYLDANIDLTLSPELRTAAEKGVPLYFVAELQIVSSRSWWFDKTVVDTQRTYRVFYNVLTRQWRVGNNEFALPLASLDEALSFMRNIRGWAVAETSELDTGVNYDGRLRLRLDTTRLPRPFQIDAYNSSAWTLATPWKNFQFEILDDEQTAS